MSATMIYLLSMYSCNSDIPCNVRFRGLSFDFIWNWGLGFFRLVQDLEAIGTEDLDNK